MKKSLLCKVIKINDIDKTKIYDFIFNNITSLMIRFYKDKLDLIFNLQSTNVLNDIQLNYTIKDKDYLMTIENAYQYIDLPLTIDSMCCLLHYLDCNTIKSLYCTSQSISNQMNIITRHKKIIKCQVSESHGLSEKTGAFEVNKLHEKICEIEKLSFEC